MYRLFWLLLFVAGTARAEDPGDDTWLTCYVGRGGLDSPQEVYQRVVQAIASDDTSALTKLVPDQCNALRAFDQVGADALRHIGALTKAAGWPEQVAALRALVTAEGISMRSISTPSDDTDDGPMDEDWPGATVVSSSDGGTISVHVSAFEIDGRWFLWSKPSITITDRASVIGTYRRLAARIADRLRKVTTAADATVIIANWMKADQRPIAHVQAALLLLRDEDRVAMKRVGMGLGFSLRSGPVDDIPDQLLSVFPDFVLPVGVAVCDDYFARRVRCDDDDSEAFEDVRAISADMRFRVAQGDGAEVEEECRAFADSDDAGGECPGDTP